MRKIDEIIREKVVTNSLLRNITRVIDFSVIGIFLWNVAVVGLVLGWGLFIWFGCAYNYSTWNKVFWTAGSYVVLALVVAIRTLPIGYPVVIVGKRD